MGPPYRGNLFKNRHTPYGLRGEGSTFELPSFNLKFQKKNSFSYLCTKLWNSLPSQIRVSRDVNDFKINCKIVAFLKVSYSFLVTFLAIL